MKKIILAIATFFLSTFLFITCFAEAIKETKSTTSWLSIIDSGNYSESWIKAAPFFQSQISKEKWEAALKQVRIPLGKVISRKVIHIDTQSSLSDAPDGKYKVITLSTHFEHKPLSIETVSLIEEQNEWRVVGYFIK